VIFLLFFVLLGGLSTNRQLKPVYYRQELTLCQRCSLQDRGIGLQTAQDRTVAVFVLSWRIGLGCFRDRSI